MAENAFTKDGASTDGIVLHPRAYVSLKTLVDGEEVSTGIIPNRVTHHKGDHTKASEASVTLEGAVLPFPLRLIGGSVITLFAGVTDDPEGDVREERNVRFVGFVEDFDQDTEARSVTLKAFDLSMPLRKHKPLLKVKRADGRVIDPTPRYTDTLRQAIDRILSVVPGFEEGTEPFLDVRDTDALSTAALGSLVDGRAKKGPIYIKPEMSAWEAIELVCGLAVRHVAVELTDIVVRTSEEVFARTGEEESLYFIVGTDYANAYPPKIHKKIISNRKGVRVVAWDTEQCKRVEALYPSDATMKSNYSRKRPPPPKKKKKKSKPTQSQTPPKEPEREVYELEQGHYTQEALDAKAKSIWLQRATQEAEGTISTPLWTDEVLGLQNGDRIFVKLDEMLRKQLEAIGDEGLAVQFLQEQFAGMDAEAARTLLDAMKKPLQDFWYVNTVTYDWPGPRLCTVGFINLLEV